MAKDSMRSATMPKDHWEDKYDNSPCAGGKYASEFRSEEELLKRERELANYVKKNRAMH